MGPTHGPLIPLDSTLPEDENGDFYATGAQVSPGVVVVVWTSGGEHGTAIFEARAVRWTQDLQGQVGPQFIGPAIPPDSNGQIYESRLMRCMRIAEDVAFVMPGDSTTDPQVMGWRIRVDPASLVITFMDTLYWPTPYFNRDFGFAVPGAGRSTFSVTLQTTDGSPGGVGFASFNDSAELVSQYIYVGEASDNPIDYLSGFIDRGDNFVLFAAMAEDWVPSSGTSGHLGYRPGYHNLSVWVVPSIGGRPAETGTKVMVFNEGPIDLDGVYPVLLPNGHIHMLCDIQSYYIYGGDPNTSKGLIFDIDPATWTYRSSTVLPYIGNGFSGGLQDYGNLTSVPGQANMSMFSIWSYYNGGWPASDGIDGLRVGTFDGTTVVSAPVVDWATGITRYSNEVHAIGGGTYIMIANMDGAPDVYAQVYVTCGTMQQQGEIDGAMDLNRSAFW